MAREASNEKQKAIRGGGGSPSAISPAAEMISSNVDLLTEIFLRSPAKSLTRFKSVSKHWLSLISHPHFSTKHSSRNPTPSISGLYFYSDGRLDSVSLPGHQNNLPSLSFLDGVGGYDSKPRILDSCNGLLLCVTGFPFEAVYIVCNLTTQKYKVVPKPRDSSLLAIHGDAYLAFDPSKSPHYKFIVCSYYRRFESGPLQFGTGAYNSGPFRFGTDAYNSESGNWKKIIASDPCSGRGVFWSGAIYWLLSVQVMRFGVDAEEMTTLRLRSHSVFDGCTRMYFGACCDGLIVIQTRSSSILEVVSLEVGSDTCGWILKYSMTLETVGSAFPVMKRFSRLNKIVGKFFVFKILCVVKGEKKEDYALVLAIPGKVIIYNTESETLSVIRDLVLGEIINEGKNGYAYPFVETLCLV